VGTYTFTYAFAATGNCAADDATVTIIVSNQPEAGTGGPTTICETSTTSITLFSLITGGDAGGTWTASGGNPAGGTFTAATGTFNPTGATPGTYTFTYAFAAGGGCAADQTTVTEMPLLF
jgi:valyl-tRNA synthetase